MSLVNENDLTVAIEFRPGKGSSRGPAESDTHRLTKAQTIKVARSESDTALSRCSFIMIMMKIILQKDAPKIGPVRENR